MSTPRPSLVREIPPDLLAWLRTSRAVLGKHPLSRRLDVSLELLTNAIEGRGLREGNLLLLTARAKAVGFVPDSEIASAAHDSTPPPAAA